MDSSTGAHQRLARQPARPHALTTAAAGHVLTPARRAAVRASLTADIARIGLAAPLFGGRSFSRIHAAKERSTRTG
jgi:hypothetical protein